MATTTDDTPIKRGDRVRLIGDLPGVPDGTEGKAYLVDGLQWTRYRVLFDNGADVGAISRDQLERLGR